MDTLSNVLGEFEDQIREFQENEGVAVSDMVMDYVGAMRRGSSDQTRRGSSTPSVTSIDWTALCRSSQARHFGHSVVDPYETSLGIACSASSKYCSSFSTPMLV